MLDHHRLRAGVVGSKLLSNRESQTIISSFTGPVGYNILWENRWNGSECSYSRPKNPKFANLDHFRFDRPVLPIFPSYIIRDLWKKKKNCDTLPFQFQVGPSPSSKVHSWAAQQSGSWSHRGEGGASEACPKQSHSTNPAQNTWQSESGHDSRGEMGHFKGDTT